MGMVLRRDTESLWIGVRSVLASCLLGVPRCHLTGEPPGLAEIADRHTVFHRGRKDGSPHVVSALFDGDQGVVDPLTGLGRVRRDNRFGHVSSLIGLSQGSPKRDFRVTYRLAGLNQGFEEPFDALSGFLG